MTLRRKLLFATASVLSATWLLLVLYLGLAAWQMELDGQRSRLQFLRPALLSDMKAGGLSPHTRGALDRLGVWGLYQQDMLLRDASGSDSIPAPPESFRVRDPDAIAGNGPHWIMTIWDGTDALDPYVLCMQVHPGKGRMAFLMEHLKASLWMMLFGTAILILVLYLIIERFMIRPLDHLVEVSRRIAKGDYTRRLSRQTRLDELGELERAFDVMQNEIANYREQMESRIAEAIKALGATQNRLAIAQRLAATGRLAAGIAHELNNPIGGMINAVSALRKGNLTESKTSEYLHLVATGLDRISNVLGGMLTFTRDSGETKALRIHLPVHEALKFVAHSLKKSRIEVDVDLPVDLPMITGNVSELQQVFLNLFLNACDAMTGGGRLLIRGDATAHSVRIVIEDTGHGMTAETMAHALDYFYTTRPIGEGSGLGLPIAYNLITRHGGTLVLSSVERQGTRITIQLPVAPSPPRR